MWMWLFGTVGVWYLLDSAQHTRSGNYAGTVIASVPSGRSTRASSPITTTSSKIYSNTPNTITQSKTPSGNGSASASPFDHVITSKILKHIPDNTVTIDEL